MNARATVEKGKIKKPFRIVSGIVTYNSSWDEPIGAPLKNALRTLSKNQQIAASRTLRPEAWAS